MSYFVCPVCKNELNISGKSYICSNKHCFDIAKKGYVNLLTGSAQGRHGDDKLMVEARTAFLDKGFYNPLSDSICKLICKYLESDSVIVDAGCGEGKYTCDVLNSLKAAGKNCSVIGLDISKDAVSASARRSKEIILAVASTAEMPLNGSSVDMILNIFSPFIPVEFSRVLKKGGKLLRVVPLERHLWELKELVYDNPYENEIGSFDEEGFKIVEKRDIKYRVTFRDSEIMDVFRMTPYYYKTGRDDQKKAEEARILETQLEFGIILYEKI